MKEGETLFIDEVKYQLIEKIGEGGGSYVWKVQSSENIYAVKFLKEGKSADKSYRFNREIEFVKKTNHSNIVEYITHGKHRDYLYYVMPIYSKSLRNIVNTVSNYDELLRYIIQLCKAVKFLHSKGAIHRDLKPENILVEGKKLVLADFGISKFYNSTYTKDSAMLCNRNYLSPEQKIKNNNKNITKATDIFSLGIIINECFTKQNLSGSNYKLISDKYPLLYKLDRLVENMIHQNADNRPNIQTVYIELLFITNNIKNELTGIESTLKENFIEEPKLSARLLSKIYTQASEDILSAKYLLETKTSEELNSYNPNWHMNIGYSLDEMLYNICAQERIFDACKSKFENYLSIHSGLDITNNTLHIDLFNKIKEIVDKYRVPRFGVRYFDLSDSILKYFSCCRDYHCSEILNKIQHIEESLTHNLKNSTILNIVQYLKCFINENKYLLAQNLKYKIDLEKFINIDWLHSSYFLENDNEDNLLDYDYFKNLEETKFVLNKFRELWNVTYSQLDNDFYSIKFSTYKKFQKFRKKSIELSKSDYLFEGDVLDIFRKPIFTRNIVEIRLSKVFDIPHTLSRILSL